MNLRLDQLYTSHVKLRGYPIDLAKMGGLALQRAGHTSPAATGISSDEDQAQCLIEWTEYDSIVLKSLDSNRVTEDGAEAVALAYVNVKDGWVVKRRLQRGEHADWLMSNPAGWLALEVSGTVEGDPNTRLNTKLQQVARCTLPAEKRAVVVAFETPALVTGKL